MDFSPSRCALEQQREILSRREPHGRSRLTCGSSRQPIVRRRSTRVGSVRTCTIDCRWFVWSYRHFASAATTFHCSLSRFSEHSYKPTSRRKPQVHQRLWRRDGLLTKYRWPGNIRELVNAIERAVSFASDSQIRAEDLPDNVRIGDSHGFPLPVQPVIERQPSQDVPRPVVDTPSGGNSMSEPRLSFRSKTPKTCGLLSLSKSTSRACSRSTKATSRTLHAPPTLTASTSAS